MGVRHAPARHPADHGARLRALAGAGLVALAALAIVVPLPVPLLARWRQAYGGVQSVVTPATALLPLPMLDLLLCAALSTCAWLAWTRRRRWRALPIARALLTGAAGGWLLFLASWGWHYQVPTLEARLAIAPAELTQARAEAFAAATVAQVNARYAAAHAQPWPARHELPGALRAELARVLPSLGVARTPLLPRPRRTVLDWYFRSAGIDGMTNPFGLEVLLNSRVLAIELPALAAHEYAHLAGFADESDASVVAWLVCQGGAANQQYSAAIAVLPHLLAGLPGQVRRGVVARLDEGPRRDLRAIAVRLAEQEPWVHAVAWQTYDGFLKANRVGEGVARYDAVARVLIAAADPVTGRLRRLPTPWPASHR